MPFLLLHNIGASDIVGVASDARLTNGVEKLVSWLQFGGWKVFCITTSYEPYAIHLTHKLGIYAHNVASTVLPWNRLRLTLGKEELALVKQAEDDILTMPVTDGERIKRSLDSFFKEKLVASGWGEVMMEVKPVGGRRKVAALDSFADKYGQPLANWVVVGAGLSDASLLEAVEGAGGLAIAFNASEPALSRATMSLAATSISPLASVLEVWRKNQRREAEKLTRGKEKGGSDDKGYFHWLVGKQDLSEIIGLHQRMRRLVWAYPSLNV